MRFWWVLLLATGCASIPPSTVHTLPPPSRHRRALPARAPLSDAARTQRLHFGRTARDAALIAFAFDLPANFLLGEQSAYSCKDSWALKFSDARLDMTVRDYDDLFIDAMRAHGYSVSDGPRELEIWGRVMDAIFNYCTPDIGHDEYRKIGNAWLKIEWTVTEVGSRTPIYQEVTEGQTRPELETPLGRQGIIKPAFVDAVHRLALSEKFRTLFGSIDGPGSVAWAR